MSQSVQLSKLESCTPSSLKAKETELSAEATHRNNFVLLSYFPTRGRHALVTSRSVVDHIYFRWDECRCGAPLNFNIKAEIPYIAFGVVLCRYLVAVVGHAVFFLSLSRSLSP